MIEQLPRYRVDEVIVMLDVEEFFHNHPTPEIAREWTKNLVRARDSLAGAGIAYSLNPWITRGHEDRGRRAADALPGIQRVVHADGTQATCVACNLSPVWRDNLRRVWSIYAGTKPHVLWLDDDIRDFGAHECFCPLHLEKFSRRVGKKVTREELVAAILKPGEPHPWRAEWLAVRAEASLEVMRLVADAAHAASPQTTMGLMSSGPRNHCREGRDWHRVAEALGATSEHPIFSRPTMGNYWEWGPPRGLYFSQDSIKLTRHCLPPGTIDCTELENVPFTRYSKSVAFTFAQLAVSFAFGARSATLDVFDFVGTPMQAEPHYGKMLGARKNYLNALAEAAQHPGVLRGVRLLFKENSALMRWLVPGENTEAALAAEGYPALEAFEAAGVPTTYDESEVTFLCGCWTMAKSVSCSNADFFWMQLPQRFSASADLPRKSDWKESIPRNRWNNSACIPSRIFLMRILAVHRARSCRRRCRGRITAQSFPCFSRRVARWFWGTCMTTMRCRCIRR
jgi:hypothetical protein